VNNAAISIKKIKLEFKDVLPNINYTQAPIGSKNAVFCPGDLDL